MNMISRLLRGLLGGGAENTDNRRPDLPSPSALLEEARTLARAGREHDASRVYSQLEGRHASVELFLEHADMLLAMGDSFGAATKSVRVLDLEPNNARALAIQREILRLEYASQAN